MELKSLNMTIADKISQVASDKAIEAVVNHLVDIEIKRRADALEKAINIYEETNRELRKIKPDNILYDLNGKVLSENYSKNAYENHRKLTEKLQRIEKIVKAATEENKWGDLYNLSKGKDVESKSEVKKDDTGSNQPTGE